MKNMNNLDLLTELVLQAHELIRYGLLTNLTVIHTIKSYTLYGDLRSFRKLIYSNPPLAQDITRKYALLEHQRITAPLSITPLYKEAKILDGPIEVGTINAEADVFGLCLEDFMRNLVIYGQPGTGKSSLCLKIIKKLLKNNIRVLIFDAKFDYAHIAPDFNISVIKLKNLLYNPWEPPSDVTFSEFFAWIAQCFSDVNIFQDLGYRAIYSALVACAKALIRIGDENVYPKSDELLQTALSKALNLNGGGQWNDFKAKFILRLRSLFEDYPCFNVHRGIPIEFFQKHSAIITGIQDVSPYTAKFIVLSIWLKLFLSAMFNGPRNAGLKAVIIVDEAYWLFDSDYDDNRLLSNTLLKILLRQGREFGIGVVVLAQEPRAITQTIRDNAGTIISFRLQASGVEQLKRDMGLTTEEAAHVYRLPARFGGMARTYRFDRPFLFEMDQPEFNDKRISEDELDRITNPIISPFLHDAQAFNAMVARIKSAGKPATKDDQAQLGQDAALLLELLLEDTIGRPHTALHRLTSLSHDRFSKGLQGLIEQGLIVEIQAITAHTGKTSTFYPPTKKAGAKDAPERFAHKYYCTVVENWLKKQGKIPFREFSLDGYAGRIDVAYYAEGKLFAYEITLSMDNLIDNITKCLEMKASKIYIVAENKKCSLDAERKIENAFGCIFENIRVLTVSGFFK